MIKINLIPVKEKKKRQEFFVLFCVVVFFILVASGMLFIYIQKRTVVNDLNKQIDEVKKESESYQDKINEMKDLQAKKDSLDAIKKTIQGISETQRKILAGIDQIAVNLPDGMWITRIEQGKGNDSNKFTVQGMAASVKILDQYFGNLQRPGGLLKEVTLDDKGTTTLTTKYQVHQFEISFRVADAGT